VSSPVQHAGDHGLDLAAGPDLTIGIDAQLQQGIEAHFAALAGHVAPKKAAKTAAKPAAPKPIKEPLTKSGLVAHIADTSGVAPKDVRAVMAALQSTVQGSISKKGAGSFTLPGLLKIKTVSVAAKPRRKGINPFTKEEQWFAAKPASTKLKATFMKSLKDAAA